MLRTIRNRSVRLGWMLLLAACEPQAETPVVSEDIANGADQVMFGVEHFVTGNGVVRGKLVSDTAFMYEDSALVRVRPVNLTLFDDDGNVAGEVMARTGVLNTRTQTMVASGSVVVEETGGDRIETEELHFDPNRDRVWSVVATTIHRDGSVLRGTGFTSNTQLTDTRLDAPRGQVQGLEF